jgi:hypothetical protein
MCLDCSSGNGVTISSANAVVSLKDVVATNVAAIRMHR